jgi:hypothetical protein
VVKALSGACFFCAGRIPLAKSPAFQFYTGDWFKDPSLRACSLAARGLWIDMLCFMWESPRRGFLQHPTGKPYTPQQLARLVGCSEDEVSRVLTELQDAGVFSRTTTDVIYCRRMERDEKARQQAVLDGRRGGNPTLRDKGGDNPPLNGRVKPIPTPSSSSAFSSSDGQQGEPRVRARDTAPTLSINSPEAVVWNAFDPVLSRLFPNGWQPHKFVTRLNALACDLLPNTPAERREPLLAALAAWLPSTKCDSPQGAIGLLKAEWARCLDSGREPGDRAPLAPIVTKPTEYVNGTQDQSKNIAAMEAALNRGKR